MATQSLASLHSDDTSSVLSSEASQPKKKGFFGKSSKDDVVKPPKVRATPIKFTEKPSASAGNFLLVAQRPNARPTARKPKPFKSKANPTGAVLDEDEEADTFADLPSKPVNRGISSSDLSAADLKAAKNLRRQSLPPQAPTFNKFASQPPRATHTRRPSDEARPKPSLSSITAAPTPTARPEPVQSFRQPSFNVAFPEDKSASRRHSVAVESTASSYSKKESYRDPAWANPKKEVVAASPIGLGLPMLDLAELHLGDESSAPKYTAEAQLAFDSCTRNLAKLLHLSLVYIVAIDLSKLPSLSPLTTLSSSGTDNTTAPHDPKVHFAALRAPERGLLYQRGRGTASSLGMLIPILEHGSIGYVLAGLSTTPGKEFEDRDVKYLRRFATELENWVVKVE
ncbi:hypothetical protein RQP46_002553 [Phenoliferia psychrophenolica]